MQTKENWKKSPAVEKCKMKTEEKPRQKQQNEQAKRLGEYLNFRIQEKSGNQLAILKLSP